MPKKFKLGNSENRSLHKTIPGTDTKSKVEVKSIKFKGTCSKCKRDGFVVIRIMFNPGIKGDLSVSGKCPLCRSKVILNGVLN